MLVQARLADTTSGVVVDITAVELSAVECQAALFHCTPHRRAQTVPLANWKRWQQAKHRGEQALCFDLQAPAVVLNSNPWTWEELADGRGFHWHAELPDNAITGACLERLGGVISFDLLDVTLTQLQAEIELAAALSADGVTPAAAPGLSAGKSPAAGSDGWQSPAPLPVAAADPLH